MLPLHRLALLAVLIIGSVAGIAAEERHESFDRDPHWDGHNNRAATPGARSVRQDFGYSRTAHAGGAVGEIGGFITPDALPAYYAKKIPARTFQDTLSASGTLACTGREFNVLIGFFNADTLNEWRTPNTIALRLYGRGDVFYAYVEYMTGRWRAGADSPGGFATVRDLVTGQEQLKGFASGGAMHTWSLKYDPQGNAGGGAITVTLDSETSVCHLAPGHKADGAVFNRFGLLNVIKHVDGGGKVWLDDVTINGETEHFTRDPSWDQQHNRTTYLSWNVRPRFDFGYSPTRYAGGKGRGELGGLVFRGDCRTLDRMAYYGDRLDTLTLDKPLKASGRISLRRAVSDSTTLIGFFHSRDSLTVSSSQARGIPDCFVGIEVEGPSREGFLFYPTYGVQGDAHGSQAAAGAPYIYPDGVAHDWTLEYLPTAGGGTITVTLDGKAVRIPLEAGHRARGARFDRFGIVTTWIDGNGQQVYLDDLSYTCKQE
ncbi:MAG TPA: hypothetical protein VFB21_02725 [Chthonomonadaceae bacterium]|nr:hypothetical protein [Chthonomonadaceae bacterium]